MSEALAELRLLAVGSMNPVKVGAARRMLERLAPLARVDGVEVEN